MTALDNKISLSSASLISHSIQQANDGFSTTATIASLVNNQQFKQGYNDLILNHTTQKSYLWEALSAVSEDFGQSLYLNVKNYIDNVSNVDTCKIKALKSMLKMLNVDYSILEKIEYYPLEIQNLMDILSISKKYLLSNKYIKQDFLDAMCQDNIASCLTPEQMACQNAISAGSIGSSVDYYKLSSDEAFDAYLSGVYGNFIYDMLLMRGTGICSDVILLSTGFLSNEYGISAHHVDRYLSKKKDFNIDVNFNVAQVVDDIENGIDSIDNYSGKKLILVQDEIKYRKQPEIDGCISVDLATRDMYYRKRKVVEYADFVDNMVFLSSNFPYYSQYAYDKNYITLLNTAKTNSCISNAYSTNPQVVSSDVAYAAQSLAQMTRYIAKLRESIRLQTRKIFMKGTNNLLKFAINEFLIDYAESLKINAPANVLKLISKLKQHRISDVKVQEYWDMTEYMNISSDTSQYAENSKYVNGRYFDDVFSRINNQLIPSASNIFSNEEINKFYLNDLGLDTSLHPILENSLQTDLSSNMYEFLSVLFDVAANASYYDENGKFGAKFSDSVITEQINADLSTIAQESAYIYDIAQSASYQFDEAQPISSQIYGFERAAQNAIVEDKRHGISSIYDSYYPLVESLSAQIAALAGNFINCITKTYAHYFCKSTNKYSYDDGQYLFNYYVGNVDYAANNSYEMSSTTAREWINNDNCYTFSLSVAIDQLSARYDECKTNIDQMIDGILSLDFINPGNVDLDSQMDSVKEFIDSKIQVRNTYLYNALQDLRNQALQAKSSYDTIASTFSSVLASLPTLPHQNFYMTCINAPSDSGYRIVDATAKIDKLAKKSIIYDSISQATYVESTNKEYIKFKKNNTDGYIDDLYQVNETDSLENQMKSCVEMIDFMAQVHYGSGTSAPKTVGTSRLTVQTLQASTTKLTTSTLQSIIEQAKELFNLDLNDSNGFDKSTYDNLGSCIERIEHVASFLNTKLSEQNFAGDAVMSMYYENLRDLNQISNIYVPARSSYEALWSEFEEFFSDYAKSTNYRQFIPDNIDRINEYRQRKDLNALQEINDQFDQFDLTYQGLVEQFVNMCNNNILLYQNDYKQHVYMYNGNALEFCIEDFNGALVSDIEIKDVLAHQAADDAVMKITKIVENVAALYQKYFPGAISGTFNAFIEYFNAFNQQTTSFQDIILSIAKKLDYTNDEEYNNLKLLFQNYSGVVGIATDPYYNQKNQTHPSYQIHPFLWNLIERNDDMTAIEKISQQLLNIDYDELEASNINSKLNKIIGNFGNVIDVWKNNIYDFTGYSTKYERSNHICKMTGLSSEVVGYEGAFYPPALTQYLQGKSLDSISRYCSHLKLDDDTKVKSLISQTMSKCYASISNIAKYNDISDVYDIYKYYIDAYDNIYILYKKYNISNPTEFDKRNNTPGELWIRLADFPIALPAKELVNKNLEINLPNEIYDICMIESGNKIILTGKFNSDSDSLKSQAFYIKYETNGICGVGNLSFYDRDPNSANVYQTAIFPSTSNLMYLGSLNVDATLAYVVYIETDGPIKIKDNPNVYIYQVSTLNVDVNEVKNKIEERGISIYPAISYHSDEINNRLHYVDIAFYANYAKAHEDDDIVATSYKNLKFSMLSAANGMTFSSPIEGQINSLDLISNKLVVKSINVLAPTTDDSDALSSFSLQTNTDMGYVPSYTYNEPHKNVLDIRDDLSSSYQMIELLGKSKDIKHIVENVNPDVDPYVTKETLLEKHMYGRVYENGIGALSTVSFSLSNDNTVNIFSNETLYENMPDQRIGNSTYNYVNGHYQWNIYLNDAYSYEKLRSLRLFIYSTTSLGKNPYVVADMSYVIDQSNKLPENIFLSTNYNASKYDITTCTFNDSPFTMALNGTQNGIDQIDSFFSNKLPNVSDFTYKFSTLGGGMYLKLDFKLEYVNNEGFIPKDVIKVALVDLFDLTFYEWYHYIDPGVTFGDYQYVVNNLSGDPLTKKQLLEVDLSKYNYLSDVQVNGMKIFATNRKLQFKASEEELFSISSHNYYVPSLNTKYPMTIGQAFDSQYNIPEELLANQVNVFEPDEVFELEVADASLLCMLEDLQLEYSDNIDDDVRVYEDYLHVATDGTANNSRYAPEDPRFYQYVHLFGDNTPSKPYDLAITEPSAILDVRVDLVDGNDPFSKYLSEHWQFQGLSTMHSESYHFAGTYVRDFDFSNIQNKEQIIHEIKNFMRLYFNYAKEDDSIAIYVNYANYINSPYVKIENRKPYLTIIPDTYLKLLPGENGIINIVLQLKQFLNGMLMAVNNIKFASFRIYNVSDDKPKFVIDRISQL